MEKKQTEFWVKTVMFLHQMWMTHIQFGVRLENGEKKFSFNQKLKYLMYLLTFVGVHSFLPLAFEISLCRALFILFCLQGNVILCLWT